jgi:hypothetical protein
MWKCVTLCTLLCSHFGVVLTSSSCIAFLSRKVSRHALPLGLQPECVLMWWRPAAPCPPLPHHTRCAALCCADYVDENGELLDEIILPQGALTGKDEAARGSAGGGARRSSKSAGVDGTCVDMSGLGTDFVNQAAFAAIMQQGAWQVGGGMWRGGGDRGRQMAGFIVSPHPSCVLVNTASQACVPVFGGLPCRAKPSEHPWCMLQLVQQHPWTGLCSVCNTRLFLQHLLLAGHVAQRQDSSRSSAPRT